MSSQKLDILVVGAHPDDAEIGCGGTIAHYKKMGKQVGILDCSNGEPTPYGSPEKRSKDAKKQVFPEAVSLPPRESGFYDGFEPLNKEDIKIIKELIEQSFKSDKFSDSEWNLS